jgi:hypothetical protein
MVTWSDVTNGIGVSPEERAAYEQLFDERFDFLLNKARMRGHLYPMTAEAILLQYRMDFARANRDGTSVFPRRLRETNTETDNGVQLTVQSLAHLPMYVLQGWETGIFNECRHLQERFLTKEQLMELVLFGQLYGGIRGLQHVYNAVAKLFVDYEEREGEIPLPSGWAADPEAFRAGLDLSVRRLTEQDHTNITSWFETTIGYVPDSVSLALRYHPEFYKWHRARWELIFQTLPKQTAPYVMTRLNMIAGIKDALRESVLLGKAWGINREWTIHGLMVTAWYTGFEALYIANEAVSDILDDESW